MLKSGKGPAAATPAPPPISAPPTVPPATPPKTFYVPPHLRRSSSPPIPGPSTAFPPPTYAPPSPTAAPFSATLRESAGSSRGFAAPAPKASLSDPILYDDEESWDDWHAYDDEGWG